jgi:hypothetical protein
MSKHHNGEANEMIGPEIDKLLAEAIGDKTEAEFEDGRRVITVRGTFRKREGKDARNT